MAPIERYSMTTQFSSPMQKMQFEAIVEMVGQYNSKVDQINAATGDAESLTESFLNSNEFASIRNQIAHLKEQLDAAVKEKVDAALANKDEDTTALQEETKELKGTINSGITYYKKLYNDSTVEALPKLNRVKGARVGGGGGGGRRVRGYNVIVTETREGQDDVVNEYDNFAGAAKALGTETHQLQEQFFAKAGVEKLKDAPDEVVFGMSWDDVDEDGNKTPVTATVKAYRTGPSGPPQAESASDEAEAEAPEVDDDPFGDDE